MRGGAVAARGNLVQTHPVGGGGGRRDPASALVNVLVKAAINQSTAVNSVVNTVEKSTCAYQAHGQMRGEAAASGGKHVQTHSGGGGGNRRDRAIAHPPVLLLLSSFCLHLLSSLQRFFPLAHALRCYSRKPMTRW
jgi:hypothetical protein